MGECFSEGHSVQEERLIELDDQRRAKSYLDFTDGHLNNFVIPGFDYLNTSETAFTVDTTISKSVIRDGDTVPVPLPAIPKPFRACNFRLNIDGLPTTRVRTIDPLSVRPGAGGRFVPEDLVVTFQSVDVDPWQAWVNDFIVNRNHGPDKEKQGTIEIMRRNSPRYTRRSRSSRSASSSWHQPTTRQRGLTAPACTTTTPS